MNKNTFAVPMITLFLIIILSTTVVEVMVGIYSITYTLSQTVAALSQQPQQLSGTTISNLQSHFLNSIFNQTENSVVQITSKVPVSSSSSNPSNPDNEQNATALGSGFVYDTKGHIITNNHVVSNAKIVDVTFIRSLA
ncbi:MAG: S1C family serine protease [Candidatus Nitrosocosmicus sp.]